VRADNRVPLPALLADYEVVAMCRLHSLGKLAEFEGRIDIVPGATDNREVIERAIAGCDLRKRDRPRSRSRLPQGCVASSR
jgi:hypothetical protein